jgi:hypothetical protein
MDSGRMVSKGEYGVVAGVRVRRWRGFVKREDDMSRLQVVQLWYGSVRRERQNRGRGGRVSL